MCVCVFVCVRKDKKKDLSNFVPKKHTELSISYCDMASAQAEHMVSGTGFKSWVFEAVWVQDKDAFPLLPLVTHVCERRWWCFQALHVWLWALYSAAKC